MCSTVEGYVVEHRRVKVTEIANSLGISSGTVETILHTKLGISKVASRWMPRMLTPEMKQTRFDACTCQTGIQVIKRIAVQGLLQVMKRDFMTGTQNKQESLLWKHKSSPAPKKFRTQASFHKEKRRGKLGKGILLLHDNAPSHATKLAQQAL